MVIWYSALDGIVWPEVVEHRRLDALADDPVLDELPTGVAVTDGPHRWKGSMDLYGDRDGSEVWVNLSLSDLSVPDSVNVLAEHLDRSGWVVRTQTCHGDPRPRGSVSAYKPMDGFVGRALVDVWGDGTARVELVSPDDMESGWRVPELDQAPAPVPC